ncbi:Ankyrin repeat and KH domain-containing protein 1 [Hondaea fermentalgiana]|uniref:Ankyrin repeat and KH domain-containing protein 1 n=1 Tax=Hondaea fermentalgiana TaxID=2315210 RepID=A0A2R5GIK7_9STRA|nr:Ankyrin repeat and KH domain-containing protein 1 [Hondaea fermentalgiana]|eukprot:GBG30726.1 Ankyrin repeat and KH domain-containing protein 1 [Hondaea fermentalgiana]
MVAMNVLAATDLGSRAVATLALGALTTVVVGTAAWWSIACVMLPVVTKAGRRARSLQRLLLRGCVWARHVDRISMDELQEFEHEFHDQDFSTRLQHQSEGELVQVLLLCAFHGLARTLLEVSKHLDTQRTRAHFNNALLIAASNGRERVVRTLVHRGLADINAHSSHHNSALILAASKGHEAVVKLLIAREHPVTAAVDVNRANSFRITALASACELGHSDIVDAILRRPDVDPAVNANLAVQSAARRRHDRIVLRLLEYSPKTVLAQPGQHVNALPLLRYLRCAAIENTRQILHIMTGSQGQCRPCTEIASQAASRDQLDALPQSLRARILAMAFGLGIILVGPNRNSPSALLEALAEADRLQPNIECLDSHIRSNS